MTNMVSNLHAGKDFYLDSLKNNYHLSFSDDFASVMEEIEREYKEKNKLTDTENTLLVRNWQDILAVYIYEKSKAGVTSFTLDASCKDDLARIFAEMNPDRQGTNRILPRYPTEIARSTTTSRRTILRRKTEASLRICGNRL